MPAARIWTESAIIAAVLCFYEQHQRWPQRRDFTPEQTLPSLTVVTRRMQTWEEPVRQAQRIAVCTAVVDAMPQEQWERQQRGVSRRLREGRR